MRFVYRAEHNEEGGRFWRKSNENIIAFLDDESVIETDMTMFCWASLSQIKELALMDNVRQSVREDDRRAAIAGSTRSAPITAAKTGRWKSRTLPPCSGGCIALREPKENQPATVSLFYSRPDGS